MTSKRRWTGSSFYQKLFQKSAIIGSDVLCSSHLKIIYSHIPHDLRLPSTNSLKDLELAAILTSRVFLLPAKLWETCVVLQIQNPTRSAMLPSPLRSTALQYVGRKATTGVTLSSSRCGTSVVTVVTAVLNTYTLEI